MSDPERWLDDPQVPEGLKRALDRKPGARPLDGGTRSRVGLRLGKVAVGPLAAIAGLSLKSAAALGLLGGATVAGAIAVVERQHAATVAADQQSTLSRPHPSLPVSKTREHSPSVLESAPTASVTPPPSETLTLNPPSELPHTERPPAPSASTASGLAAESALLERARQALSSAPDMALSLVREHAQRFPNGQLSAERRLLEVDALYRVGRHGEARALATRLLAGGGDDLYLGRVQRLLEKMRASE